MALELFWRQFCALFIKNWIVFSRHPIVNILRCFVFPVAAGIFLSEAGQFLTRPSDFGIGEPAAVRTVQEELKGGQKLIWLDATDGNGAPSPTAIMARVTNGLSSSQLNSVKQVSTSDQLLAECIPNFNGFSDCYAAVVFRDIPQNQSAPIIYDFLADSGLGRIDVEHHNGDVETRVMPLQWAIDKAIIEIRSGLNVSTPLDWPFTTKTNAEQNNFVRTQYIEGITIIIVLAFFVTFMGVPWHTASIVARERASQVTAHMKAMGLLDSARIISSHVFISLVYLPSWIIVTIVWHFKVWTYTNFGLLLLINVLFGLSLASWSFFVAAPFGKSPQLAALAATFLSILFAVVALFGGLGAAGNTPSAVFTFVFPPSFYIFAIKAIDGYERQNRVPNAIRPDFESQLSLISFIIVAIINIFVWPCLAVLWERWLYDAKPLQSGKRSWMSRRGEEKRAIDTGTAVSVQGLAKTFRSLFGTKVTAIADLTIDIHRTGIFVLLGSNGAGKSTFLGILGGLISASRGVITFEGGTSKPPRGTIGIVPQQNVLFPDLTCVQTLKVWSAVKWSANSTLDENFEQLLRDCDLQNKIYSRAGTLSGGQKRKLQLAIGLVGGSKLLLCTSGVDPLSRRAIWRALVSFRQERTIVLTTHLLDEADLLADHIAILASPGKLVASDSPISMKKDLGNGYTVQLSMQTPGSLDSLAELLGQIQNIAPDTRISLDSPQRPLFHLGINDSEIVSRVLALLDAQAGKYGIVSYDVLGTTIEDIFLDVMTKNQGPASSESGHDAGSPRETPTTVLKLADGKAISPLRQALIIFYKRMLILRRSWLAPLAAIAIAVAGSVLPLSLMNHRARSCAKPIGSLGFAESLYLPDAGLIPGEGILLPNNTFVFTLDPIFASPPGVVSTLGIATTVGDTTERLNVTDFSDTAVFTNYIQQNYNQIFTGGVSFDFAADTSIFAWEASNTVLMGPAMLNLATNIILNRALNASGHNGSSPSLIQPTYQSFPIVIDNTFAALEWFVVFALAMAIYPAFSALYVARERESAVKTMHLSNGISNPIGLWLGHLMFDSISILVVATLIVILFAHLSHQFYGLGILWFIIVLYGITGTLMAYCMTLIVLSPLSAFAATAGYQVFMFIFYVAGYLLSYTYADPAVANNQVKAIHFTLSLLSPVASLARAGLLSVNLFSLLCSGGSSDNVPSSAMIGLSKYGGPILYLILQSAALFTLLFWVDSGSVLFQKLRRAHADMASTEPERPSKEDVDLEAANASEPSNLLQVLDATKSYGSNLAVDRLSFGVSPGTVFCMVGPNGAGKTTSINMMSGAVVPERGDVLIKKSSVITETRTARVSLGVCPQFSSIDAQLSVREHLMIYGRLKGLGGQELESSIQTLLLTTGLHLYENRLAGKLSGGNKRKLSLSLALIGNPPVILIDEFSTGIDAKIKREMWTLLRTVATSKAFVITTHSMEEAAALATKVGILAVRLLAVGTADGLSSRYATYEVHFTCRTPEDVARAERLMAAIPGAQMVEDLATRFEVPISNVPLAELFRILAREGDFPEYTIEKATLESMFLKVIRENNIQEDDPERSKRRRWPKLFRR
ncbi:hypothetical protein B0H19DRAFT_1262854 [Mycena capillaripes]|nr:hypothetical protein B0H19DRAFT_1262854 [Mycena capillaripes]